VLIKNLNKGKIKLDCLLRRRCFASRPIA